MLILAHCDIAIGYELTHRDGFSRTLASGGKYEPLPRFSDIFLSRNRIRWPFQANAHGDTPLDNEQLQFELDTLVATQAGLMAIVGSLMATHPDYEKFQLHLTGLLEILLSGEAGKTFTKKQRQQAREFVETLQHLNKAPEKIEPLEGIPKLRKKPPSA